MQKFPTPMVIVPSPDRKVNELKTKIKSILQSIRDIHGDLRCSAEELREHYHRQLDEHIQELDTTINCIFQMTEKRSLLEEDDTTCTNDLHPDNTTNEIQSDNTLEWTEQHRLMSMDQIMATGRNEPPRHNISDYHSVNAVMTINLGAIEPQPIPNNALSRTRSGRVRGETGQKYMVKTLAGGTEGYRDGFGTDAKFHGPVDITYCPDDNLYVSDDRYVRKITKDGMVSTFFDSAHSEFGICDFSGIDCDKDGNLYVVDSEYSRIIGLSQDGGVCNVAGKKGVKRNFDGDINMATFNEPCGVCVDADNNVMVADTNNHTIRCITAETGLVSTIHSGVYVTDIAVNNEGIVFILDGGRGRISYFAQDSDLKPYAGTVKNGSKNGPVDKASFKNPSAITIDKDNNIYVADCGNNKIRKITPDGYVTTLAGTGRIGKSDGLANKSTFDGPIAVAVDDDGIVYVADSGNSAIRVIYPVS